MLFMKNYSSGSQEWTILMMIYAEIRKAAKAVFPATEEGGPDGEIKMALVGAKAIFNGLTGSTGLEPAKPVL
jgi:hypothetical protein